MKSYELIPHILNMSKDVELTYKALDKLHDFIDFSSKHGISHLDDEKLLKYYYEMLGREIYERSKIIQLGSIKL